MRAVMAETGPAHNLVHFLHGKFLFVFLKHGYPPPVLFCFFFLKEHIETIQHALLYARSVG